MVEWVGDYGGRCEEIAALRDCRAGAKSNQRREKGCIKSIEVGRCYCCRKDRCGDV